MSSLKLPLGEVGSPVGHTLPEASSSGLLPGAEAKVLGSSPGLMIHPCWGLFTSPLGLKIQGFTADCITPLV